MIFSPFLMVLFKITCQICTRQSLLFYVAYSAYADEKYMMYIVYFT